MGSPDFDFRLRAEHAGGGPGRVYSITYISTDDAGSIARGTGYVTISPASPRARINSR